MAINEAQIRSVNAPLYSQYQPPFFDGGQLLVPNFENEESEKNECLGGFKEFLPWIFAWGKRGSGGTMFLVKKRLLRI